MRFLRKFLEPLVVCAQVSSAFFDTGLQMVVKERCANASNSTDGEQTAISNFYMTYNMLSKFMPILPGLILARFGDKGYRKLPIVIPLIGYFLSRLLLVLVITIEWPIEVMFGGAVIHGLCGGFASYWAGVMALVSVSTSEEERSVRIMRMELFYGLAGLFGSLASGHLFQLYTVGLKQGVVLAVSSVTLYFICLLYATFVLKTDSITLSGCREDRRESSGIINHESRDNINIALLFASGILYDIAVGGGMEILASFVLKNPLNWNATQVGYGNAAGFIVFITSFIGVKFFSKFASDTTMILIGMLSFTAGIYFMAFVTTTTLFYLARSLTLFALIPMPTIRSLLSKQVSCSSYAMTLILLQLSFKLAGLVTTPMYTKIYQATLDSSPGFVFTLSSIITVAAIIPISIVGCRIAHQPSYERIQGN
ncbi:thymic stromal cotransporter homolog [Chanos chanos]|uniref:Thymic stromal cotransporter homolog n=1 Tax=Chanos chanos TaxID=29144 RepID=A0A6J2V289_CHACN|nr:thymic stromal cotransporter homolog [Chanos chanos]